MSECADVKTNVQGSVIAFSTRYEESNGARLLAYWDRLRGDRARARWSQFDFMDISDIAPFLIVKDVIDGGAEFRNRYWGTQHVLYDGMDGTGKTIADYYRPEHVKEMLELYRLVLDNPTPMVMRGKHFYHDHNADRDYAALVVGFEDEDGNVAKIVCAYDEKGVSRWPFF